MVQSNVLNRLRPGGVELPVADAAQSLTSSSQVSLASERVATWQAVELKLTASAAAAAGALGGASDHSTWAMWCLHSGQ